MHKWLQAVRPGPTDEKVAEEALHRFVRCCGLPHLDHVLFLPSVRELEYAVWRLSGNDSVVSLLPSEVTGYALRRGSLNRTAWIRHRLWTVAAHGLLGHEAESTAWVHRWRAAIARELWALHCIDLEYFAPHDVLPGQCGAAFASLLDTLAPPPERELIDAYHGLVTETGWFSVFDGIALVSPRAHQITDAELGFKFQWTSGAVEPRREVGADRLLTLAGAPSERPDAQVVLWLRGHRYWEGAFMTRGVPVTLSYHEEEPEANGAFAVVAAVSLPMGDVLAPVYRGFPNYERNNACRELVSSFCEESALASCGFLFDKTSLVSFAGTLMGSAVVLSFGKELCTVGQIEDAVADVVQAATYLRDVVPHRLFELLHTEPSAALASTARTLLQSHPAKWVQARLASS